MSDSNKGSEKRRSKYDTRILKELMGIDDTLKKQIEAAQLKLKNKQTEKETEEALEVRRPAYILVNINESILKSEEKIKKAKKDLKDKILKKEKEKEYKKEDEAIEKDLKAQLEKEQLKKNGLSDDISKIKRKLLKVKGRKAARLFLDLEFDIAEKRKNLEENKLTLDPVNLSSKEIAVSELEKKKKYLEILRDKTREANPNFEDNTLSGYEFVKKIDKNFKGLTENQLIDSDGNLEALLNELKKEAPLSKDKGKDFWSYDTDFREKLERRDDEVNKEIKKIERDIEILEKEKARHEQELANKPEKVDIDQRIKKKREKIKEKEVNARDLAKRKEKKYREADKKEEESLQLELTDITGKAIHTKKDKKLGKEINKVKEKLSDVQSRKITRFIAYLDLKMTRIKKKQTQVNPTLSHDVKTTLEANNLAARRLKGYAEILLAAKINGNLLKDKDGNLFLKNDISELGKYKGITREKKGGAAVINNSLEMEKDHYQLPYNEDFLEFLDEVKASVEEVDLEALKSMRAEAKQAAIEKAGAAELEARKVEPQEKVETEEVQPPSEPYPEKENKVTEQLAEMAREEQQEEPQLLPTNRDIDGNQEGNDFDDDNEEEKQNVVDESPSMFETMNSGYENVQVLQSEKELNDDRIFKGLYELDGKDFDDPSLLESLEESAVETPAPAPAASEPAPAVTAAPATVAEKAEAAAEAAAEAEPAAAKAKRTRATIASDRPLPPIPIEEEPTTKKPAPLHLPLHIAATPVIPALEAPGNKETIEFIKENSEKLNINIVNPQSSSNSNKVEFKSTSHPENPPITFSAELDKDVVKYKIIKKPSSSMGGGESPTVTPDLKAAYALLVKVAFEAHFQNPSTKDKPLILTVSEKLPQAKQDAYMEAIAAEAQRRLQYNPGIKIEATVKGKEVGPDMKWPNADAKAKVKLN